MSKSIFAVCEALAPASRQADLPCSNRSSTCAALAARDDRKLMGVRRAGRIPAKSRDDHLTLQELTPLDNLIIGQKGGRHVACSVVRPLSRLTVAGIESTTPSSP